MPQTPLTTEERLELAAKLDRDLDTFIDNLPKRQPQENIPFDRWEEEIANHPFFMKELPQDGTPLHPLYEGLQKLKYDPEENEPEELALAYKDDGNFNFKHKKYRMAIIAYTEGLRAKCGNAEIEASLYNNRSASHFFLENYRSALRDAEAALKLKPHYDKALIRAANCCFKLRKFDEAFNFCDKLNSPEAAILKRKCLKEAKVKERDERKSDLQGRRLAQLEEKLTTEIKKRGIQVDGLSLSKLEPQFPQLFHNRVHLKEGRLIWPVVFFYPEYRLMDYIQEFDEQDRFLDQLSHVFGDYPEWDRGKKYKVENLNVYFEDKNRRNVKLDVNKTLLEILKLEGHVIQAGTPKFIILVKDSEVERLFLSQS